jgi:cation transport ATPase
MASCSPGSAEDCSNVRAAPSSQDAARVPIAAGALYPTFCFLLSPIIAAAAMALSSVSVSGNALRPRAVRL